MTQEQFEWQIKRLESTFGEKYFDVERLDLIRQHVMWMEMGDFAAIVSHFIATFKFAPLPKDFKEAMIQHRNQNSKSDLRSKPIIFDEGFSNDGLKKCLEEKYPGALNLQDAIDQERLKIKVKEALK